MKSIHYLKYLWFLILPITTLLAFHSSGWFTFAAVILAFGIIPSLELIFPENIKNLNEAEEMAFVNHPIFDVMIYFAAISHWFIWLYFFYVLKETSFLSLEFWGISASMGMMCGVIGINVGHELGHRVKKYEQWMAQGLLLTSLYTHFFIEHNRGHHRNVSTPEDPSSARRGEWLYFFWLRSVVLSWLGAWKLEAERLKRAGKSWITIENQMLRLQIAQIAVFAAIYSFFGFNVFMGSCIAACIGFLMLETVNYIEHYGLVRKKLSAYRYEPAGPEHSWNSDHIIGRVLLFELSRHSDHHYQPNRKYQILRHFDHSPQMPTGYPGMMLLSLIPPLWFAVMHKHPRLKNGVSSE